MAFAVTSRHTGKTGSGAFVATQATNSTTPTADSLLIVSAGAQIEASTADQDWLLPTGGGLTYTERAESTDVNWAGDNAAYKVSGALWTAPIGGSPSAFAITVDALSGAQLFAYDVHSCDITGHDTGSPIVQSKAASGTIGTGGSPSDSGVGTIVLDAEPTAGSLLIVHFAVGADAAGTPASPTAGPGKTFTTLSSSSTTWCPGIFAYRICDGDESATITCSDLGQQVGNYTAQAIEIRPASVGEPGPGEWLLEDGSGVWLLEDSSGGWLLENSPDITEVTGTATGSFGFTAPMAGPGTFPDNGAGAPAGWTQVVNLGSVAVTNNQLVLTSATGAYAGGPALIWTGMASLADLEATYEVTIPDLAESYPAISFRADTNNGNDLYPLNGLGFELQPAAGQPTTSHWIARQVVNGTKTDLGAGDFALVAGAVLNVRERFEGSTWKVRLWYGGSEPGTWNLDVSTVTMLTAGKMFVGIMNGSAGTAKSVSFDNINIRPIAAAAVVTGVATGVFGFTAPSSGVPAKTGVLTGSFGFTAPANGVPAKTGVLTGAFGFNAPASGLPSRLGVATGSFGFTAPASGEHRVTGSATGSFGFTSTVLGFYIRLGAGVGFFGFSAPASGAPVVPVTGTATGSFGFTAPVQGTHEIGGTATGSFGFSAPASGVSHRLGVATGVFGFVGPASGAHLVLGAASGSFGFTAPTLGWNYRLGMALANFGFTGPAQGQRLAPVLGNATGLLGFSAPVQGTHQVAGTATGSFGFSGPATGKPSRLGQATGSFGFTAPAVGQPVKYGVGTASFGFTAPAEGVPVRPGQGTASGDFGFSAPVQGRVIRFGIATGAFGFTGPASGQPTKIAIATGVFGFTAPVSGVRVRLGVTAISFGFTAPASGSAAAGGTGVATGVFGFVATAIGLATKTGAAIGIFGFDAPALGSVPVVVVFGTATGLFGFSSMAGQLGLPIKVSDGTQLLDSWLMVSDGVKLYTPKAILKVP